MSQKKAAIYHFTDGSQKRPIVNQKQIFRLTEFAKSRGFEVAEVFCDKSLLRYQRTEFDRFMSECNQFDALIVKDFYHLSKNTMKSMSILKQLRDKGLEVHTPDNGSFVWSTAPFEKSLKVATYTCHLATPKEMEEVFQLRQDIFKVFTEKKTDWIITDQFADMTLHQRDGEQHELQKLIANRDKYDLLLVQNLNDIHWRTSNFCRIREALELDIYSLQDGYLEFC